MGLLPVQKGFIPECLLVGASVIPATGCLRIPDKPRNTMFEG